MTRLLRLLLCSFALAIPIGTAATVSAGGWAVSTLDELPSPAPGETVTVGFTIRQHGVSPVNVDDVGVVVTGPSGATELFPATQDGAIGHYVADVVFDSDGVHTWAIRQGWFGDHDLGEISTSGGTTASGDATAPASTPASTSTSTSTSTKVLRYVMPVVALALAAYAVVDAIGSRRRRTVAA